MRRASFTSRPRPSRRGHDPRRARIPVRRHPKASGERSPGTTRTTKDATSIEVLRATRRQPGDPRHGSLGDQAALPPLRAEEGACRRSLHRRWETAGTSCDGSNCWRKIRRKLLRCTLPVVARRRGDDLPSTSNSSSSVRRTNMPVTSVREIMSAVVETLSVGGHAGRRAPAPRAQTEFGFPARRRRERTRRGVTHAQPHPRGRAVVLTTLTQEQSAVALPRRPRRDGHGEERRDRRAGDAGGRRRRDPRIAQVRLPPRRRSRQARRHRHRRRGLRAFLLRRCFERELTARLPPGSRAEPARFASARPAAEISAQLTGKRPRRSRGPHVEPLARLLRRRPARRLTC